MRDEVRIVKELPSEQKKKPESESVYSMLANDGLPEEIQKLRCRVNFRALYERDMLAFTGCIEGCSKAYPLKAFENHSNQMATLDFIVVVESDIFLATYGGNMAKVVEGHRRYLGFKTTILPNTRVLVNLSISTKLEN
ncbi:hypothetical protein Dsin_014171 [Dipteronia sinensis]|uniref:O-fucosyltransferase family protein n=1 Tax=Dipteronia sinensis TaxID=43782 RepID=A0AAE0ALF0_9ROSI|nr:hypothetical protein Dsin_014171 [Dipteronia sinensis]